MTQNYQPGSLVSLRGRDWIVMPSNNPDLLMVKPLGGTEEEITGIYLPLGFASDQPEIATFPLPSENDLGDFFSANLLYNASRLSFRNAAGPFRSIGKYSFRPRAYQMVPLIMALRQEFPVRMLIADDVGIGKTIESLMIVRELMDRGEIKRFAIICLPHLCEQWQAELQDKFGIEAVIIRSSTAAKLDRKIASDESVFHYFPYQVISIDYIKAENRRETFIHECPEMVVVDEAHTCTRPDGGTDNQQQRFALINKISQKEGQHLLLLTATPHSGKQGQFQSLLGLIDKRFENINLERASQKDRELIAKYFVQRRRKDIEKWISKKYSEETPFPERLSYEIPYKLSADYAQLFNEVLEFARDIATADAGSSNKQRLQYWTALGILRGVMSSPRAGYRMLQNRAEKTRLIEKEEEEIEGIVQNPVFDKDYGKDGDTIPSDIIEKVDLAVADSERLNQLANQLQALEGKNADKKIAEALKVVKGWLKEKPSLNAIIYCRYISTAEYVGEIFKTAFKGSKSIGVEIVTSNDPDELRKEKVESMSAYRQRILVATDCMSEGINLQELFTAVLHYDLPWNPNRLEQREGRVDRYGQIAKSVKVGLLYGEDNPMDGVVLKVLLRKAIAIKKAIGISVPLPEDNDSIMEAVTKAVLMKKVKVNLNNQQSLFNDDELNDMEVRVEKAYKLAEDRERATRSIFAQHAVNAQEIEEDLREVDEVIGNVASVERFMIDAITFLGGTLEVHNKGYRLWKSNLPYALQSFFDLKQEHQLVSFDSPTPDGYRYIGRNHQFVEQLCQIIIDDAINSGVDKVARVSIIRTAAVKIRTTLIEFRVRNVIGNLKGTQEVVAEEMLLWGYTGEPNDRKWISQEKAKDLFKAIPVQEVNDYEQKELLADALGDIKESESLFEQMARERAEHLIQSHERFRQAVGGHRFKVVEPVLPMDVLGIYILVPAI